MTTVIHLQPVAALPGNPRRLNAFPGRHLGEREFQLLQAYVDDRLAPLIHDLAPGILVGLEVATTGQGADLSWAIRPGQAVGAQGRLVRLFFPLQETWADLRDQVERERGRALDDGLYFLTLRAGVEAIDADSQTEPCTRTEPDPLRDRRLESVSLLGLQLVSANPRLLALPPQRAANRVAVRFLTETPFDARSGAVPLGLLKVSGRLPEWFNAQVGRFMATPTGTYEAFQAHTLACLEDFLQNQADSRRMLPLRFVKPGLVPPLEGPRPDVAGFDPKAARLQPLGEVLGLDFLPAAGVFPITLLQDPAGVPPRLAFAPGDLQVELAPVPASTVSSVVASELPRGKVDLIHGLGERIRLLMAIPDLDYRPDLFDLPQRDLALEDELFQRGWAASLAYGTWSVQWQVLFKGLTTEEQARIHPPSVPATPRDPEAFRGDLVSRRRATMEDPEFPLPEPYRSHVNSPHPAPAGGPPTLPESPSADGLLHRREALLASLKQLQADWQEGQRLLNELGDFNTLQRQHLDALSISFSSLAGGVPGDGKGLDLLRKSLGAVFVPKSLVASGGKP